MYISSIHWLLTKLKFFQWWSYLLLIQNCFLHLILSLSLCHSSQVQLYTFSRWLQVYCRCTVFRLFPIPPLPPPPKTPLDLAIILHKFKKFLNLFLCWDFVFVLKHVNFLSHNITHWAYFFCKWDGPLIIFSFLLGPCLGESRWIRASITPPPPLPWSVIMDQSNSRNLKKDLEVSSAWTYGWRLNLWNHNLMKRNGWCTSC